MAFPHVVYGNYGDEKVTSTSKIGGLSLGTVMELPDGRRYRHARNGGTALVAGNLYNGAAGEANTAYVYTIAPSATIAVGATIVTITSAGTALGANVYDGGYLITASSTGTGIGYVYKVKNATTTAADSTSSVSLEPNDAVKVALEGNTTKVGMRKNEYDSVVITTSDTASVNTIAGVACATAAASAYVWLQRKGPAAVLTDGVLLVGKIVVASTAIGGAVAVFAGTVAAGSVTNRAWTVVGETMSVAASVGYSLINLRLE